MPETHPPTLRIPRRVALLAAMFLFLFMGAGAQQAYLVRYLGRVTSWTGARAGIVVATVYFSMLIFRLLHLYLFSNWTDRGLTVIGSLTYLLFTLVMLVMAFAPSFPLVLAGACVWGMGGAMMWAGTTMQTLTAVDEAGGSHGTGMGLLYCATHAGWMVGAIVLGNLYRWLPDDRLYCLYATAAGITLIGNLLAFRLPRTGHVVRELVGLSGLLDAAVRGRTLIAGFLQLASALAFGLFLSGMQRYVEQEYGQGKWIWLSVAMYPATRMVLSLVGGYLADRIGHAAILCGGFLAGAGGLCLAVIWHNPLAMLVTSLTLAMIGGMVPVVVSAMIGAGTDVRRRPLVYGIVFSWRDLGVVIATVGVSLLALNFDLKTALTVFLYVFLGCAILSLLLIPLGRQRM